MLGKIHQIGHCKLLIVLGRWSMMNARGNADWLGTGSRRHVSSAFRFSSALAVILMAIAPAFAENGASASAVERMSTPGHEADELARRVGTWSVVNTIWPTPGAQPIVMTGLVAERTMIGPFMQEVMRPAPGSKMPDFQRIAYLSYDRVEGRWKYVSMDTRFPAGIMPAWSFGGEEDGKISLLFQPLGFVGFGPEVEGRFTASDFVISRDGDNHEVAEQHFLQANGSGKKWLAVRYDYTRQQP
ncbi:MULTISPECIES: DUF1579 family protein [unclassified Mesorhizobium]|uniref:DUF1579 family protein n=1 Tax=unclassified Mesorhizobium TaxID=325217 RepID=UPI003335BCEE